MPTTPNQTEKTSAEAPARGLEDLSHRDLVALCRRMREFIAGEIGHLGEDLLETLESGCILNRATGKPMRGSLDEALVPAVEQIEQRVAKARALLAETPDA